MTQTIIDSIRELVPRIYKIRDEIGAVKEKVYILKRTWKDEIGVGNFTETFDQMLPSPGITNLTLEKNVSKHGTKIKADIMLRGIPMASYKYEDIDDNPKHSLIEKFYLLGDYLHNVVSIEKTLVSYNVFLRKTQKRKSATTTTVKARRNSFAQGIGSV